MLHKALLFAASLTVLWSSNDCYQFFLEGRTKRCFREDVPLSTDAMFSYNIAHGPGAMSVNVRITDAFGKEMYSRSEADHGVFTLHVPNHIPSGRGGGRGRSNWALTRDDDVDGGSASDNDVLMRQFPDAVGDNRLPYFICFEHARSLHLPRLTMHDSPIRRRIIFALSYGMQARSQSFYDDLAKEKHLSSTEEMFHVVEDRVSDVIRKIDEMRQRERMMDKMTGKTSQAVVVYGVVACFTIALGAFLTSYSTMNTLSTHKRSSR